MNIKDQFALAQNQLTSGAQDEAIATLERILKVSSEEPNSLRLLGLIRMGRGENDEALKLLAKATAAAPKFLQARLDYGRALFNANRLNDAHEMLTGLLKKQETSEAWQLLGNVCSSMSNREAAVSAFKSAVRTDPFRSKVSKGVRALTEQRNAEAEKIFRDVLRQHPDHVHALIGLATLALDTGNVKDAKTLLNHGLRISPHTDSLWRGLARAYSESAAYEEAKDAAERAVKLAPEVADCWTMLGTVLAGALEPEKARAAFAKSLSIKPEQPRVWLSLGHVEKTIGNPLESESAYAKAYAMDPLLGEAMWSKADLKTYRFSANEIEQMEQTLSDTGVLDANLAAFHFALGKAYEDDSNFDRSFHHYEEGNRIKARLENFSIEDFKARNKKIRAAFPHPQTGMSDDSQTSQPIFILGMPRAGSTLIEQILASHSQVEGTMELPQILNFTREVESVDGGYARLQGSDGQRMRSNYAERYLRETEAFRSGKKFFIDKMPNNFAHIGFIANIFPEAIFIDARRSPMDCCFSVFKQNFARGQTFSYGLERVAEYYKEYRMMMNHWHAVMPKKILEVRYENVVADLESEVQRLLDHCGLDFEQDCVDFHKTDRAVRTASAQQVRQPIYKTGVSHWRNFEAWLTPLQEKIGPELLNEGLN